MKLNLMEFFRRSNITYGTDFKNKRFGVDSSRDALMAFLGIERDFHYTFFEYESAYIMVGLGRRRGANVWRLVMGILDRPSTNWKDYKFSKQYKRHGFLWLSRTQKIKIGNMRGLYSAVGNIVIDMVAELDPEVIAFNGYTQRMTDVYKTIFKGKEIQQAMHDAGYEPDKVKAGSTWLVLRKSTK